MAKEKIDALYEIMLKFFGGDAKRCQHLLKVHSLAAYLGRKEGLDPLTQETLELAALCHDCGIKEAEARFGYNNGKLQEEFGPEAARELLAPLCLLKEQRERIFYLVGHHHTYDHIEGMDYQILVEADFLVNFYEDALKKETIEKTAEKIFVTAAGKALAKTIYALNRNEEEISGAPV